MTKNTFLLELAVPEYAKTVFTYQSGQYLSFKLNFGNAVATRDFSMVSAPFEANLSFGIKINAENSFADYLFKNYQPGDFLEVSAPKGRFVLTPKPHEFRTILGFAGGIGITPILSHFKNILHNEPRTRLFLFYSVKNQADIAFKTELETLEKMYRSRLQIFYFLTREAAEIRLFSGRIDAGKLKLIINQILHLDDTDEESTIWDSVDEVLICGKGEMIRDIANACHDNGIRKQNIHFELFEEFNEDIYPQEVQFPLVENIEVDLQINAKNYTTTIAENTSRLLQALLMKKFPVPYSCKSGICGSCICKLEAGEVELLENEYLTEKEAREGKILACMSVLLSKKIKVNFDIA